MSNKIQNLFFIFIITCLILMCFFSPEHQLGFIISIIFTTILWANNYFESKDIDKLLEYANIFDIFDKVNTIVGIMMKW